MRRDIEVSDDEVDDVGERVEIAVSACAVLDDLDDAVQSLGDGVGQIVLDKGEDVLKMNVTRLSGEFSRMAI